MLRKHIINSNAQDRDHMPLIKRAWVLKEQVLSPRLVYFTAGQMLWQCRSLFTGEDEVEAETTFSSLGQDNGGEFDLTTDAGAIYSW
jgi:hypothetical protein